MDLYLMRHGIAAPGSPDGARPLTRRGVDRVRQVARALRRMKIDFDLILASPLLRARATGEIVAEELSIAKRLELTRLLAPGADRRELVEWIGAKHSGCEQILLVGHEPMLSALIAVLISGKSSTEIMMKKAGVCKLRVERIRCGRCASLQWLLTPAHLIRLRS